jgi:hypothetical protein
MRLSLNEYKSILKYYNIDITCMKNSVIKKTAEDILAEKLCRCIKAVNMTQSKSMTKSKSNRLETKAIAVCKNSVFTKKNLKISKFTCKKKSELLTSKKSKKLVKISKKLSI